MSLWSFFSDKNAEDKKQTELLRQATAKNAEDVVRDNNNLRVAQQWLRNNQDTMRSYEAEAMKAAMTGSAVKNLYGLNEISKKMGTDVSPNEVSSLGKDNQNPVINLSLTIGADTIRRAIRADVQSMVNKTINEEL